MLAVITFTIMRYTNLYRDAYSDFFFLLQDFLSEIQSINSTLDEVFANSTLILDSAHDLLQRGNASLQVCPHPVLIVLCRVVGDPCKLQRVQTTPIFDEGKEPC